tara:strand:+ start:5179 stop:6237 length:1059 start_codon:yes stop_codon:yes gene_type:complete
MKKFYVKDCPDHKPVHIWIGESLGMEEKFINKMKPKNPDVLYEFEDTLLDLEKLKEDSEKAFEEYGWYGFLNIFGGKFARSDGYGGLSLVYNKDYRYENIPDNAQTLGYPRSNFPDELFTENFELFEKVMEKRLDKDIWSEAQEFGMHHAFRFLHKHEIIDEKKLNELLAKFPDRKDVGERINLNTYSDTWGFNRWSDPAKYGYLNEIVKRVKRSPVRSRLAQIKNIDTEERKEQANKYLWHRDDTWFYELRINLSLHNENNVYGIEIENYGSKPFIPGNWYVWDTYVTHRPYVNQAMPGKARTNYVLAVNPWFDWIEEEQCWIQNEFYGEKHPADMVIEGDAIEGLKLVQK